MDYDDAVDALYQAPHGEFVNERKRLAGELKTAGDKAGASKLGKLARPPISAWAVNQLWRQARDEFDELFETAEKLRGGDLGATAEHREAIAKLRARAAVILAEAGNAAAEGTLRRVGTTLAALAALGGFDPDPPGALSADRDPPGFDAVGIATAPPRASAKAKASDDEDEEEEDEEDEEAATKREQEAAMKRELEAAAAERRKKEAAESKQRSEIRNLEQAIGGAKSEVERKQKDLDRLKKAVEQAEAAIEKSQATVDELEAKLAQLVEKSEEAEEE